MVGNLEGVELLLDPSRDEIWSQLSAGTALCLFSQPSLQWKEQIGLPIVEALSVGLEVISSNETGVAGWLVANGHRVVAHDCSSQELATVVADALRRPRSKTEVMSHLPRRDGRMLADSWLHRPRLTAPRPGVRL